MTSHHHKYIYDPYNYYYGSNVIRPTWIRNQDEDYTTQNSLEFHQDADHDINLNRRRLVPGIIHTRIGVAVFWKVQIQTDVASDSTGGEIRCIHKDVNKNKYIQSCM